MILNERIIIKSTEQTKDGEWGMGRLVEDIISEGYARTIL